MMFFLQNMKNPVACFAVESCKGAKNKLERVPDRAQAMWAGVGVAWVGNLFREHLTLMWHMRVYFWPFLFAVRRLSHNKNLLMFTRHGLAECDVLSCHLGMLFFQTPFLSDFVFGDFAVSLMDSNHLYFFEQGGCKVSTASYNIS